MGGLRPMEWLWSLSGRRRGKGAAVGDVDVRGALGLAAYAEQPKEEETQAWLQPRVDGGGSTRREGEGSSGRLRGSVCCGLGARGGMGSELRTSLLIVRKHGRSAAFRLGLIREAIATTI